jgi:hypothetical protein
MKNKPFFFTLLFAVLLFSCSLEKKKDDVYKENTNSPNDLYQFKKIDLRAYELNATLYIPDETAGIGASFKTTVEHPEDFQWKVSAGPNFELFIEDWGENSNQFSDFKKQLSENAVFKTTIIQQTKNTLLYKRELADLNKINDDNHVSYHVYALIPIDGYFYEIKNKQEGDNEVTAKHMLTTIKSFKSTKL